MSDTRDIQRLLEAILFTSDKPLDVKTLSQWFPDIDESLLILELNNLKNHYEGRGVELLSHDGEWMFRSAADLASHLSADITVEKKLSRAAQETLAIIAYHQPVTRAEIEDIRGVATGRGTLDLLVEAGWVKPGRRRETPGRPLTWVTTTGFLTHFGLESVTDLPGLDDLKSAGLLDRRPTLQAVPVSGELFDEGDEDAQTVKSV